MDVWDFLLSGWARGIYGALREQGVGGCLLAAAAGWQMACLGLRLTAAGLDGRVHLTDALKTRWGTAVAERLSAARSGRWLGGVLQTGGALLLATALVALMRTVVGG
jgi:hypothetical protein